jgi:hypothetical protein
MHPARMAWVALSLGATAAVAQPVVDDAGNRMAALPAVDHVPSEQAQQRSTLHCTAARDVCLRAWRAADDGVWSLDVHDRVPAGANVAPTRRIAPPPGDNPGRESYAIWPHVIREASGALLIGALRNRSEGFSGGGAGMTQLVLLRLGSAHAEPVEVLTVQTGYSAMIRACFSEEDYRSRGACHDEYELTGTIRLAPAAAGGRPRLTLVTRARSFPRGARAEQEQRRIRRSDLVWEPDPACSYRRSFSFNPTSGRYEPDRALPECSSYQLP